MRLAFDLAAHHFQIDPLLDPEDVNTNKPDKKSILMYVMCLYHAIDSARSQLSSVGSIQMLDQHFGNSTEEIQLIDGKDVSSTPKVETVRELETEELQPQQAEPFHVGNLTDLDEVSLAKSIDDLSNFPVPNIKRSSTFTITKNDFAILTAEGNESGAIVTDSTNEVIVTDTDAIPGSSASANFQIFLESHSRPLSTATNASIEIGGYQNAIEIVLSLLLEAEEILSKPLPDIFELSDAKAQFQAHEEFMIKLSEYQEYVGGALEEGARLLSEPITNTGLTMEDQSEIKQQMLLLNERWETLRMSALDVQSRVHAKLAEVQLHKIEELRLLLTNTEDNISRMDDIDPNPDVMRKQMNEHKILETSLNEQKLLVDDLSNLVVIVNDESFNDLEDKLSALGERWTHVVKWTKNRFEKLQLIHWKWKLLNRQYAIVNRWLDSRENDLKQMETSTVSEIGSVMERMNSLRFCVVDLNCLYDNLLRLEETGQELQPTAAKICEKLENLEDRCEALKEIVEVNQKRIEGMGFNFNANNADNVKLPNGWVDYQIKFNKDVRVSAGSIDIDGELSDDSEIEQSPQSSKKRKLQKSEKHQQLDQRIHEMVHFVNASEITLTELIDITQLQEQRKILDQLNTNLKQKIIEYAGVKSLLVECCAETDAADLANEEKEISDVASKYDELNFRLEHLIETNHKNTTREKFSRNLTGFKLVLADCQDWFKQNANSNATQEDLQNRLSYMESLSGEINEAHELCRTAENMVDWHEWQNDFQQFFQSWTDIESAIQKLLQQNFGVEQHTEGEDNEIALNIDQLTSSQEILKHAESTTVTVSDLQKMNENLDRLNDIRKSFNDDEFKAMIESEHYNKTSSILDERIIKQTTAIENLNHFITEYDTVVHFLRNIERLFHDDLFILGESIDLERQLHLYEAHGMEIKKIEIDIISVKNFSEIIVRETDNDDEEHNNYLVKQVQALSDLYARITDLYRNNEKQLKDTIEQTNNILNRIEETETWLTELETTTPTTTNADIKNSNELFQIRSKFQILKDTCEQKTILFRDLNELGSEMLLQIDEQLNQPKCHRKYSSLAKQFTKLNARWNEVTTLVYNRTGFLEHISGQLGELKTLIVSENGYLDKLEKCLRKSPENAADAEEIYEELDVSEIFHR